MVIPISPILLKVIPILVEISPILIDFWVLARLWYDCLNPPLYILQLVQGDVKTTLHGRQNVEIYRLQTLFQRCLLRMKNIPKIIALANWEKWDTMLERRWMDVKM